MTNQGYKTGPGKPYEEVGKPLYLSSKSMIQGSLGQNSATRGSHENPKERKMVFTSVWICENLSFVWVMSIILSLFVQCRKNLQIYRKNLYNEEILFTNRILYYSLCGNKKNQMLIIAVVLRLRM